MQIRVQSRRVRVRMRSTLRFACYDGSPCSFFHTVSRENSCSRHSEKPHEKPIKKRRMLRLRDRLFALLYKHPAEDRYL